MMNDRNIFLRKLEGAVYAGFGQLKRLNKPWIILLFLVFSLIAGAAYAAVPVLSSGAFTGGGGLLANGSVQLNGSIGQPFIGQQSNADVVLCSGSPGCAASLLLLHKIYLPLVTR